MDLDDLFGAFDGAEKAKDVHEANDSTAVAAGKRRVETSGVPEGGASKRQAVQQSDNAEPGVDVAEIVAPVVDNEVEGTVALKEGEESSTIREDGTLVKSVSSTNCRQFILTPSPHTKPTAAAAVSLSGAYYLLLLLL